jgi:branched-chain amino acid transport system permease protein
MIYGGRISLAVGLAAMLVSVLVGTLIGAVAGTGLVEVVSHFASQVWDIGWPIVLGLLLLAVITFRPSGLIGLIAPERERKGSFGARRKRGTQR